MLDPFNDQYFMKQAYLEAQKAFDQDEVPVGAVIVCKNQIIARGHNLTEKLSDVTAHAEIQAITAASQYLGAKYLKECTLFVTLEPCCMCAGALYWSQMASWKRNVSSYLKISSHASVNQAYSVSRITSIVTFKLKFGR